MRTMRARSVAAWLLCAAAATLPSLAMPAEATAPDDPYLWLEDVQGDKALAWVRERNAETQKLLSAREDFAPTREKLLAVLNSQDRIPAVSRRGDWLYNLWQDADHKRGLWRRATLAEYRKPAPQWETVIDLDALGAAEKENWVWGGAECLGPDYRRCLVSLSRGGADAKVIREFDTVAKRFVDGGFALPEAKSDVAWIDADTLIVGTDFGPGSMTDSGYPRVLKRWKRGTPLAGATILLPNGTGTPTKMITASNGNFYLETPITLPVRAKASLCPNTDMAMTAMVNQPNCNAAGCHAAGNRIHLP